MCKFRTKCLILLYQAENSAWFQHPKPDLQHSATYKASSVGTSLFLFVCLGLTSLLYIWGHIATVPACSSGSLTNVLPHRNAMPQTQDTTPHPVTVYRHGANLSLCYPSMWNVTLEYTATHFNVLGETRPGNPFPTFHTHQRTFNLMLSWWSTVGSSVESTVPTGSWTRDLWCANPVRYPLAHSDFLLFLKRGLCLEADSYLSCEAPEPRYWSEVYAVVDPKIRSAVVYLQTTSNRIKMYNDLNQFLTCCEKKDWLSK